MNETISCPACKRRLHVPESVLGQLVKCPSCDETFTASLDLQPPRPAQTSTRAPTRGPNPPRPTPRRIEADRLEELERLPGRSHRGGVILTLGIMGLCLFCVPFAGWILGGLAMSMANRDLVEMDRRLMDPSGKALTQAGHTCGLIAVILGTLYVLFLCVSVLNNP